MHLQKHTRQIFLRYNYISLAIMHEQPVHLLFVQHILLFLLSAFEIKSCYSVLKSLLTSDIHSLKELLQRCQFLRLFGTIYLLQPFLKLLHVCLL